MLILVKIRTDPSKRNVGNSQYQNSILVTMAELETIGTNAWKCQTLHKANCALSYND